MKKEVLVSVVMSVYNTKPLYIKEAIESILNQTYEEFEFIIINDASTNAECKSAILQFEDKRIKYYENEENLGLTKSLNKAIELSKGEYIVRMDSDDLSVRDRLETQVEFMENHKEVGASGGYALSFGLESCVFGEKVPAKEALKVKLLFRNCAIIHPTAILRKSYLKKNNIKYNESLRYSQDYQLWVDCLETGNLCNIDKVLILYRRHNNQVGVGNANKQLYYRSLICKKMLLNLSRDFTEAEINIHASIGCFGKVYEPYQYNEYFKKLKLINKKYKKYNQTLLKHELCYLWLYKLRVERLLKNPKYLFSKCTLKCIIPSNLCYCAKNILTNMLAKNKLRKQYINTIDNK